MCWNSSAISFNIVLKNNTMMHCVVYLAHLNINCSISFLYGYPQHHKQKEIWKTLLNIKNYVIWSSAVVGDFNEYYTPHEKIGGTTNKSS